MHQDLLLLLTVVWVARDTHDQFLMAYVIEKLSQGDEDLPLIVDRVPHSDHGSTSLRQVPCHLLQVIFVMPRFRPVPIGLREGQPKEAMADHITMDPVHLLFVEMVQDPFVGVKG